MTGQVAYLENILSEDILARAITEKYISYDTMRQIWKTEKEEIRRYIFATDTRQTSNSANPWKNSTTLPKLCQIRDNLYANYTATLWPKRKSVFWLPDTMDSSSLLKTAAIENYMSWNIDQPMFKSEMNKCTLDYIDYGNCFGMIEWIDQRVQQKDGTQVGYVGPMLRRINPLDIVFNPVADNFLTTPKIIRSVISLGELKDHLEKLSNDENRETYQNLYDYLKDIRFQARQFQGDWIQQDRLYQMDGFTSYRDYLQADTCEVLTFYGDWYDSYTDTFEKNRVITVIDRHKMINNVPNASAYGYPPIFHCAWRVRPDNLWGQGPLDNLIGLQYRIDHIENMKADIWDLTTYPVQMITGFVQDYTWQPGAKIFTDGEGKVELVQPDVNIMQANSEIDGLMAKMEEMAGAPKEAMGFRSPGEKTAFEVQRLENASSRVFTNKINQFEEQFVEPVFNGELEMARRNFVGTQSIRVFDNEFKMATFQTLTAQDITGIGRIKPIAARHFAEQSQLIQNLTSLTGSGLWPFVQQHFSGIQMANVIEEAFNIRDYEIVTPYINLAEQADAQRQVQVLQEQLQLEQQTATGLGVDHDLPLPKTATAPMGLQRNPPANATPTGTIGTQ